MIRHRHWQQEQNFHEDLTGDESRRPPPASDYQFSIMDIRSRQKEAMIRMLNLNQDQKEDHQGVWKVLVYDRHCEEILSPLINRAELRKLGVTLNLLVTATRQRVPDVVAIYFVQPTQENVDIICQDNANGLYDSVYLNFSFAIPRPLLESLAKSCVASKSVQRITQIHDQYSEFISLESNLITLNHRSSFFTLNSPSTPEANLLTYVDEIVNGLFSVLVTTGVVPIIRCKDGTASAMVGDKLNALLFQHISTRSHLFNSNPNLLSFQRPLMVIADRAVDLAGCLHHAWTYQALCHDLLSLKSNLCTLPVEGKSKTYDMNISDDVVWKQNASLPFPTLAENVEAGLKAYKKEVDELGLKTDPKDMNLAFSPAATQELANAIQVLPALKRRKELLDQHMLIATAILEQLKRRELDVYFELEEKLITRAAVDTGALMERLAPGAKGSLRDKLRLLSILYLCDQVSDLDPYLSTLDWTRCVAAQDPSSLSRAQPSDISCLSFLKEFKYLNKMAAGPPRANPTESSGRGRPVPAANMITSVINSVQSVTDLTSILTTSVRNLLPPNNDLPLTKIVASLLDNKPNPITDSYLYFDPKAKSNKRVAAGPGRQTAPFKDAFVFVLGAGNYPEYQNLQAYAAKTSTPTFARSINYGSTEILSPEELLEQLARLGKP